MLYSTTPSQPTAEAELKIETCTHTCTHAFTINSITVIPNLVQMRCWLYLDKPHIAVTEIIIL